MTWGGDCVIICTICTTESLTESAPGAGSYIVTMGSSPSLLMLHFDVSALINARLGTSFTLDVDAGARGLAGGMSESTKVLEVDFVRGTIQVIRVQGGLLVQGTVESQLLLECVRCLEPFVFPTVLELEETFRLPGASPRPGTCAVGDDGWLDLTPLLREQCWLAIPMKPLCHPDCRGLCPRCGVNLNFESCACKDVKIDPRLASLKELLQRE